MAALATAGASSTISRGSNGLGMIWLAPKPPPACSPKARATTSDGSLRASDASAAHAGDLHLVVDGLGPDIERAAEDVGEAEDVVHLVGIVAAAGGDDGVVAHGGDVLRRDLRVGVGERQDQRLGRHLGDHLLLEHAAGRQAEEDVGALDHLGQAAGRGLAGVALLPRVHQLVAALPDHALDVGDPDVFLGQAELLEQAEARQRRGAGARDHQLHLGDVLADQRQAVLHGCADDDRRAVLVVVEHRDREPLAQLLLDVEALRRLDVFEVDAAEGGFQRGHDLDQLLLVVLGQLDVEDVDAGEFLEQDALAFHDRLGGQGADGAQAQHGGAVGHHRHQVGARGELRRGGGVAHDLVAGGGDAGRIGERQVALGGQRLGRDDLDLPGSGYAMVAKRAFGQFVRQARLLVIP